MTVEINDAVFPTNKTLPVVEPFHEQGTIAATTETVIGTWCVMPGQNPYWDQAIDPAPGHRLVVGAQIANANVGNELRLYLKTAAAVYFQVAELVFTVFTPANTSGALANWFVPAGYAVRVAIYNADVLQAAYFLALTFYSS